MAVMLSDPVLYKETNLKQHNEHLHFFFHVMPK